MVLSAPQKEGIRALAQELPDKRLTCIRIIRCLLETGLKEAKDAYDEVVNEQLPTFSVYFRDVVNYRKPTFRDINAMRLVCTGKTTVPQEDGKHASAIYTGLNAPVETRPGFVLEADFSPWERSMSPGDVIVFHRSGKPDVAYLCREIGWDIL